MLERADSPRELGFALALAPNALKALRELGLADAVARAGAPVRTFVFRRAGGAIGPAGTTWDYGGRFDNTPVFLGCSDQDAHVPESRVRETADVFARMGAEVTLRIYPGMGHLVNDDEITYAQSLLDSMQ